MRPGYHGSACKKQNPERETVKPQSHPSKPCLNNNHLAGAGTIAGTGEWSLKE